MYFFGIKKFRNKNTTTAADKGNIMVRKLEKYQKSLVSTWKQKGNL